MLSILEEQSSWLYLLWCYHKLFPTHHSFKVLYCLYTYQPRVRLLIALVIKLCSQHRPCRCFMLHKAVIFGHNLHHFCVDLAPPHANSPTLTTTHPDAAHHSWDHVADLLNNTILLQKLFSQATSVAREFGSPAISHCTIWVANWRPYTHLHWYGHHPRRVTLHWLHLPGIRGLPDQTPTGHQMHNLGIICGNTRQC